MVKAVILKTCYIFSTFLIQSGAQRLWLQANGRILFTLWALFTVLAVENSLVLFVKYGLHLHCSKWEKSPKVFNANVGMNVNLIELQLFHNSPHTFALWVTRENNHSIKSIFALEPYKEVLSFLEKRKA